MGVSSELARVSSETDGVLQRTSGIGSELVGVSSYSTYEAVRVVCT